MTSSRITTKRKQMVLLLLKLLQRNRCARAVHDASSASFRSSSALVWRHSNQYSSEASSLTTTTTTTTTTVEKEEEEEEFSRKEKATTKKKKKQFQRRKLKEASTATRTKAKTKHEIEQGRRMEVVDLNLDWGDKVYRGNATEYAGVKVTSKLTWPIPMHALVQLNPELRSVLNLSPPTEEEEAEADKFLSVLRTVSTDDEDFTLTELEEGELTPSSRNAKKTKATKTKATKRKEEGDANTENMNALFPASMPYAHLFEAILLEAREHFPGGSRPESTRRQITKSLLQLVPRELLEDVAEEMKIWIRPAPKQPKRSVDSFRKAQKRLNFLYWLTEHWRKPAVNGKDLAITKGELGALIWSQYLEALKAVRGTNDAKFLADMISKDSDTDEIELKHVRTGGWASGSQHRAKEYVDRLTGNVSAPSSSSSSSSSSSEVIEDDEDVSSSTIERMDYPELFTPEEIVEILVKARGKDVMAIRIREKCSWADWLILCTGKSPRHISDLSHAVMFEFKKRVAENPTQSSGKVKPYIEGAQADTSGSGDEEWNAVDCGSCVVHVLSDRARRYYDIEELWANGDEILHNGEEILTIDTIKID